MSKNLDFPAVFGTIVEIALAAGARSIKDLPGCWEYDFGDWRISVNAHLKIIRNSRGLEVPSGEALIENTKYLAFAIVGFSGGAIGGFSEDELLADLTAELSRLKKEK